MVIQGSKRIYKLDLLKGAACVGVVFTHVTFPGLWGKAVMRAAGFAGQFPPESFALVPARARDKSRGEADGGDACKRLDGRAA